VEKLYARQQKRLAAKYGDSPFPEQLQLVESVRNKERRVRKPGLYVKGLSDMEDREADLAVCAELEKIIWGQTREQTAAALEKTGREIDDLISAAEDERAREAEESRRRNMEYLNRNRASAGLPPLPDDYGGA